MIAEHVRAIVWLRWRSLANSLQSAGRANAALAGIIVLLVAVLAAILFAASLYAGNKYLPDASPERLLSIWGILVLAYLISWMVGLNLVWRRSALFSVEKLLHLPVSPSGAFLCHFVASFASLSNILFLPILLGLAMALIATRGTSQLAAIPLTLALVFMATALFGQLQGWLAGRQSNPRAKTAVVVLLGIMLAVVTGTPALISLVNKRAINDLNQARRAQIADLKNQWDQGRLGETQFREQRDRVTRSYEHTVNSRKQAQADAWMQRARLASAVLPIGWLPNGILQADKGRVWPAWAGVVGMLLVGGVSLGISYRQILAHHRGHRTSSRSHNVESTRAEKFGRSKRRLVEYKLPGLSEHRSAIVMTTLRVLLRTPELKLLLTGPLYLLIATGGLLYLANDVVSDLTELTKPFFTLGVMGIGGYSVLLLAVNQFNFDGAGLRSYLLMPVARHDILLGKNLATAPVGLGFGLLVLGIVQYAVSLEATVLVASILQYISACAAFCVIGNAVAIRFPADRSKPKLAQARAEMVTQFLLPVLIAPFAFLPVYFPLGLTFICRIFGWADGIPVYLIASALTLSLVLFAYWRILLKQGQLLQRHEISILDTITAKAD